MPFWRDIVARDVETYLRELQTALASAGADSALVQDALFDAEEHLQSEMAAGGEFSVVADGYGSPEEVAAAYLGVVPVPDMARVMNGQPMAGTTPAADTTALREPGAYPSASAPDGPDGWVAPAPSPATPPLSPPHPSGVYAQPGGGAQTAGYGQPGGYTPAGVQYGMQAAGAGAMQPASVWRQIFGPFADGRVWTSLVYMLLSLGTGIAYFTLVVTGISFAAPMLIMIIGIPLMALVIGMVRALALFEGRLVEVLLGTRMPRRLRPTPPEFGFLQRMLYWLKDGRTWASMVYMLLMLPLGITYFTIAVTGLSVGLALVTTPFWAWAGRFGDGTFVVDGVTHHWWFPAWGIPLSFIGGVLVLIGMMHLIKWIGRGHAAFAKAMLVRLAK